MRFAFLLVGSVIASGLKIGAVLADIISVLLS